VVYAACGMCNVARRAHREPREREPPPPPCVYGPLIVAAAILLSVAGIVLFLHELAEARSRRAFDRIFEEGGRRRR
jgi:hypothetical protein